MAHTYMHNVHALLCMMHAAYVTPAPIRTLTLAHAFTAILHHLISPRRFATFPATCTVSVMTVKRTPSVDAYVIYAYICMHMPHTHVRSLSDSPASHCRWYIYTFSCCIISVLTADQLLLCTYYISVSCRLYIMLHLHIISYMHAM